MVSRRENCSSRIATASRTRRLSKKLTGRLRRMRRRGWRSWRLRQPAVDPVRRLEAALPGAMGGGIVVGRASLARETEPWARRPRQDRAGVRMPGLGMAVGPADGGLGAPAGDL